MVTRCAGRTLLTEGFMVLSRQAGHHAKEAKGMREASSLRAVSVIWLPLWSTSAKSENHVHVDYDVRYPR